MDVADAGGFRGFTVGAADGRAVEIRPMGPGDVDGLVRLFEELGPDDRHNRFFSLYHPPRAFVERMAAIAGRGGIGLVAVSREDGRVVGEATCSPLAEGDGELGITVAGDWRGWLGPLLLSTLCEVAASRGVPNIQAEVQLGNGAMLALLRARGSVVMGHPDSATVRLVIPTSGRVPSWPGPGGRPRVLVEVPGGRWHRQEAVRGTGAQVLSCPGPGGRVGACPVLQGRACPLAAGADLVVMCPPASDGDDWLLLEDGHRRIHADVPLVLALPDGTVMVVGGPEGVPGSVVDVLSLLPPPERPGGDA